MYCCFVLRCLFEKIYVNVCVLPCSVPGSLRFIPAGSSLQPEEIAEGRRGLSRLLPEEPGEVGCVGEAAPLGDLRDGQDLVRQHFLGRVDPDVRQIVVRRPARLLAEESGKVEAAERYMLRDLTDLERTVVVAVDELDRLLDRRRERHREAGLLHSRRAPWPGGGHADRGL